MMQRKPFSRSQLHRSQRPGSQPRRGGGRPISSRAHSGRAPDEMVLDELSLIAQRRIADPPPPGTTRPSIRLVAPEDHPAIVEMVARCSAETLRRRFHGPLGDASAPRVAELLQRTARHADHMVADVGGAVVAMASLHVGRDGSGEIAVLVEDAWQGTGVGRRMTGHLVRRARERGMDSIVADVMRDPAFVLEHLHRAIAESSVDFDGPIATVRIPVGPAACPPLAGTA